MLNSVDRVQNSVEIYNAKFPILGAPTHSVAFHQVLRNTLLSKTADFCLPPRWKEFL